MNISDKQSTSSKPQIFINHVDLSITEEDINQACEQNNTKPTSITIRKNHDQKSNNVNLTFASESEAKTLKGANSTLVVKDIALKLEEYQTIYPPNLFFKNNFSFTEEQLQEAMRGLIKGYFHMNVSHSSVFFYIQDADEFNFLISQEHTVCGKLVHFEKFQNKNTRTQLYIKFTNTQNVNVSSIQTSIENKYKNQISSINNFTLNDKTAHFNNANNLTPSNTSTTFSVTFIDSKVADDVYQELKEEQKFLEYPITVTWKRPENSEDKTICFKFLLPTVTEKQLQAALSKYGEVYQIEIITPTFLPQNKQKTLSACVLMGTESSCKSIMNQGVQDEQIKSLFNLNRPNISPFIPKSEYNSYKNATRGGHQPHHAGHNHQNQFFSQFPVTSIMPLSNQGFMPQFYNPQGQQGYMMHPQYQQQQQQQQQQQRKQQMPMPNNYNYMQQQVQYNNLGYQQHNQNKKGYRSNANYQNNSNQQNYNNSYPQNHKHQQQYQQQVNPKNTKQVYTKTQFEQILAHEPAKTDSLIKEQTKELIVQYLNRDPKYKSYISYTQQLVEMFTDKDTFETQETIDLIFNESELASRIDEGIQLIKDNLQGK